MMAIEPNEPASGGPNANPYFQAYLRAGLKPIPLIHKTKTPPAGFQLATYFRRPPSQIEVDGWQGQLNVGIVLGHGIYGMDFDSYDFWCWLLAHSTLMELVVSKTWCVRSGSGLGGHLYLKSTTPIEHTQNMTSADGVHLGEIRGDGAYLVAPPSIHESGGSYSTIFGRPDQILSVPDAGAVFNKILALYLREQPGAIQTVQRVAQPVEHPFGMRILDPSDGALWRPKWLTLSSKARKALTQPAMAGEGDWLGYPSNSEIREMIVGQMVRSTWTTDEIEQCFADQPFGDYHYRNEHARHHGRSILETDIAKVTADWQREQAAATQAIGVDWKIERVVRRQTDNPTYQLFFALADGRQHEATVRVDDMLQEKRFQGAVAKGCGWTPQLQQVHFGRGMGLLMAAICDMAEDEMVPEMATVPGYIKTLIRQQLAETANHRTANHRGVGWQTDDYCYVRGSLLISRVQGLYRPATLEQITDALRLMGGVANRIVLEDGQRQSVWVLPLASLSDG